jgi:hypothetical protein
VANKTLATDPFSMIGYHEVNVVNSSKLQLLYMMPLSNKPLEWTGHHKAFISTLCSLPATQGRVRRKLGNGLTNLLARMKTFRTNVLSKHKFFFGIGLSICVAIAAVRISNQFKIYPSSSDVAAWVQAIGSIVALAIAIRVVQIQHDNTVSHGKELERQARRRSLNLLMITLQTTASACSEVSHKAREGRIIPELESAYLLEARQRLHSIPASSIPDIAVLMKTDLILLKLHKLAYSCKWLSRDRPQYIRDGFARALDSLSRDCFLALHDTGRILAEISSPEEVSSDWRMMDLWKENHESAVQIMKETGLIRDEEPPRAKPSGRHDKDNSSEDLR